MLNSIEALEMKYSLLKDQISKFTKIVEDEKNLKEKMKNFTLKDVAAAKSLPTLSDQNYYSSPNYY